MATVRAFKSLRPAQGYEKEVAALPYDVMSTEEARAAVAGNQVSFLHIDKAEIDLPEGTDMYDAAVYAKARDNLRRMTADGVFVRDDEPGYFVYRLTMNGRSQAGIVGCASIDDYMSGAIKRHELMLAGKETDRINHVDTLDAHTGPIFLTCRPNRDLSAAIARGMDAAAPIYDFTADDGVGHTIWKLTGEPAAELRTIFDGVPSLYIADGHHRCAAAVSVGNARRAANPAHTGDEEYNYFLSAIFPADQLRIMDYNRVVSELGGMTPGELLSKLRDKFAVEEMAPGLRAKPVKRHTFGFFVEKKWYSLTAAPGTWNDEDPVSRLDVSILQNNVLGPMLGISDPRVDSRVDFVGGIRGLEGLERRTRRDMIAAFAMYPPTMDDLMDVADSGLIMPPKSTWFEPKPRSGLLIHPMR
jgi:uncharacterized protein (DUF1015 family)